YGEVIQRSQEKVVYDITGIMELPPVDNKETYVEWMANHTKEKPEYLAARWDLAYTFITTEELTGEPMIRAFLLTPREHFVREQNIGRAYEDTWLPIGYGATITDPDVVSMMTTSLKVEPQHKVLEIGTGSGYQSAILSHLSNYVYTIEIIEPLYQETDTLYKKLSPDYPTYQNIRRKLADGFYGWDEYAPFDRIIVTCAIDHLPPPLIKQLSNNGIIVVPIGPPGRQQIMQITKTVDENNNISLKRRDVYNGVGVKFIPFRDETGKSYSTSDS
ncbi:MAG: protein-L-isoaspartate O-methyltransferase, partial [Spirochaetales bacterium]